MQRPSFSIHAPSRERRYPRPEGGACHIFNPRSLAGATENGIFVIKSEGFQSTLPRGSDPKNLLRCLLCRIFQSTLPRGSDLNDREYKFPAHFSIHAPSRERPTDSTDYLFPTVFSIHAPSRERRLLMCPNLVIIWIFNPRSLAGATSPASELGISTAFSIHAPSRERLPYFQQWMQDNGFQSTLPRGSDLSCLR